MENLKWKKLPIAHLANPNEIGGIYDLEIIDDLSTTLDSIPSKSSLFNISSLDDFIHVDDFKEPSIKRSNSSLQQSDNSKKQKTTSDPSDPTPIQPLDMHAWDQYSLHPLLLNGLQFSTFSAPTEIQAAVLPIALDSTRDILGAAETGSGKTLAYGIPILQSIANAISISKSLDSNPIYALILAPTRELAIQVADHLKKISIFMRVKIATVVGGMSIQKQQRKIDQGPHIVVATPGRLSELLEQDHDFQSKLEQIKFLVIDEADRMLQGGHFKELYTILDKLSCISSNHQTFLFSATLLQEVSLTQQLTKQKKKTATTSMQDMINKIQFRDSSPQYINVTYAQVIARSIVETRVDCLLTEKDSVLYYILLRYPGKSIVFVNSIDAIRRIVPILTLLKVNVFPLHAEMQQRQRLKNLDRFKSNPNCVLVASDVASRGLDIPNVDHVIHYQLPRSADLYIHRSGRTARGTNQGLSVMLCSPEELVLYKKLCYSLKKENGVGVFPIDKSMMTLIKKRISIAKKIDEFEHKNRKTDSENNWFAKAALEADIEIDEDLTGINKEQNKESENIKRLKLELCGMLSRQLIPKGISAKYLTGNVDRGLADTLIQSKDLQMPANKNHSALQEIKSKNKKK